MPCVEDKVDALKSLGHLRWWFLTHRWDMCV